MSEDLGAHFEVTKCIPILEEALRIKSVLSNNFSEVLNNLLAQFSLRSICLASSINGVGANLAYGYVKVFLEALSGEHFVDSVREILPFDVFSLLRRLEHTLEHFKFTGRDRAFGHIQTNSELLSGNEAGSQSIEVAEELVDADTLLLAELADASNDIVLIIRRVAHDFGLADSRLCLGEVVGAVVEALVDTEELLGAVDILAEVDIVDLIDIAFIHVTAEDGLENVLGSADSEQIEHAEELVLGHVTVASDVVVLEHGFQVDALVFNRSFVLFKNFIDFLVVLVASKVFTAGEKSVSGGDGSDSSRWRLVNARDREGFVHVCAEVYIAEEALWISCLVLFGEGLELVVGQREVH